MPAKRRTLDDLVVLIPPHASIVSTWVHCRGPYCKSCPHGPYWYAHWRAGKHYKIYVGNDERLAALRKAWAKAKRQQDLFRQEQAQEQEPTKGTRRGKLLGLRGASVTERAKPCERHEKSTA